MCSDDQYTRSGSGTTFANVITARTLLGHDSAGIVYLIQFDGISWETGCVDVTFANACAC